MLLVPNRKITVLSHSILIIFMACTLIAFALIFGNLINIYYLVHSKIKKIKNNNHNQIKIVNKLDFTKSFYRADHFGCSFYI